MAGPRSSLVRVVFAVADPPATELPSTATSASTLRPSTSWVSWTMSRLRCGWCCGWWLGWRAPGGAFTDLFSTCLQRKALASLQKYGVGTCGPRGFYGTFGRWRHPEPMGSAGLIGLTRCTQPPWERFPEGRTQGSWTGALGGRFFNRTTFPPGWRYIFRRFLTLLHGVHRERLRVYCCPSRHAPPWTSHCSWVVACLQA